MTKIGIGEQLTKIKRGIVEIISEPELIAKLESSLRQKARPLRVKAGFDPTTSDIHLGHTVLLKKLRAFQDSGHKVVLLIGDYTALIGDPSGQSQTRKMLTPEVVNRNAKTYLGQVSKILLMGKKHLEVRYNSEWFGKGWNGKDKVDLDKFLEITSRYNVARIIERDDFSNRLKDGKPISVLEFLYPLMQGYDSVVLNADIELGGTDQKFNLLIGRDIQRIYGKQPQVVITLPLLEGLDGKLKMSKTYNNYIGIAEKPDEIFGKIMSTSDELMLRFYDVLTEDNLGVVKKMHPKEAKLNLAEGIVSRFYSQKLAAKARSDFEAVFSQGKEPKKTSNYRLKDKNGETIFSVLTNSGLVSSGNEARRLLRDGAVRLANKVIKDEKFLVDSPAMLKVGKTRFLKITL
ncbi:MAG: tyrosine--tRNA ligase [Candidatus Omnitrophica bacterium]|nr:tyrosine--tRNA ligase [Candidatus Omnitrophota bacterium]